MTDALLGFGRRMLKERGIVDSGDATSHGIGAMRKVRWDEFFHSMEHAKLYKPDLDVARAYTLRFVDKGVGVSMRPK